MSNTVQSYDLSYEGDEYASLVKKLNELKLPRPGVKILESLAFKRPIKWTRDMVEHTLIVDQYTARVISNNLVA